MTSKIAITGGCGYIGTHVAYELDRLGYDLTIIDRKFKHKNLPGILLEQDYLAFFRENTLRYDAVIHLAADHEVAQSVRNPSMFYDNNVLKMKTFLDCLVATGIKNIIFSSSASVYGRQGVLGPLREQMHYDTENSYASTKAAGEMLITDYSKAYGLNYTIFRYFNAAGADPAGRAGYVQRPASHVVPMLCNRAIKNEVFTLYGNDYPTPDGTCVRDYVHVSDIASAHGLALEKLLSTGENQVFNLGGDIRGSSLYKLLDVFEKVTGICPRIEVAARRPGDPASLTADTTRARDKLGWSPIYNLDDIIFHAWQWENKYEKFN